MIPNQYTSDHTQNQENQKKFHRLGSGGLTSVEISLTDITRLMNTSPRNSRQGQRTNYLFLQSTGKNVFNKKASLDNKRGLCGRRDLNPHALWAPPPQDGASANFATSALVIDCDRGWTRTIDPRLKRALLYQLSYAVGTIRLLSRRLTRLVCVNV
jgi:hypothetical protein